MSPGDLVRINDDAVPMFHARELLPGAAAGFTVVEYAGRGEVVVVVEPSVRWIGYAQVLHPIVGVCYIRKQRLEVIDDTSPTLRPATR